MQEFDATGLTERKSARFVKSLVSPRPIAWISTISEDGHENLAPFSSYNYVSSIQPTVMFNTPNEANGGLKDTAQNAIDTGEFAVNVVTTSVLEEMDYTAASIPSRESEFELAGVERAECRRIDAPRVANAVATMECTLYDAIEVHDRMMILGDVEYFHVADDAMTDGKTDMLKIETVGRLGGPYYTISNPVEYERQQ
ncbi:MAG: flavin reductase family protein [Halobacteriota archaeon]